MSKVCAISCAWSKLPVNEDILYQNIDCPPDLPHKVQGNISCQLTPLEGCHEAPIHDTMPVDNTSPNADSDNTPWQNGTVPRVPTQEPTVEHRGSHSRAPSTNPSWPPLCQGTQPGLAPVATEESVGEHWGSHSRESSTHPSLPPLHLQGTKPGLAPSTGLDKLDVEPANCIYPSLPSPPPFHLTPSASLDKVDIEPASCIYPSLPLPPPFHLAPSASLDKLGSEPADHMVNKVCTDTHFLFLVSLVLQQLEVTKNAPKTKIIPPTLVPLSHTVSPSPAGSLAPSHTLTTPDFSETSATTISNKDDQGLVMGRVPDSALATLAEGFDEIDMKLSELAVRMKMPFHQVADRYIRSHTHAHASNLWNIYLMYFAKNMEWELSRLPKGDEVTGTPSPDVRKCCYALFKAQYQDMYPVMLEMWKEVHELENMGGTLAQWQQLFKKTIKDFNHTVSHYLFTIWILLKIYLLVHCSEQSAWLRRCLSPCWMSHQPRWWARTCFHNTWCRKGEPSKSLNHQNVEVCSVFC